MRTGIVRCISRNASPISCITQIARATIEFYAKRAGAGELSTEQAQRQAMDVIRSMRYGEAGSGYFSIVSSKGVVLMYPFDASIQNKPLSELNPKAAAIVQQQIELATRSGSGFQRFDYPKETSGVTKDAARIAYIDTYRPWDWVINTSLFVDDIDSAFQANLLQTLGIFVLIALVMSGIVVALNRGIARTIGGGGYAVEIAGRIAANDFTAVIATEPNDRGSLLYSMKRMQANLSGAINGIKANADSIASAAAQISAGDLDLSRRTEMQAASLQETAASMAELSSRVGQSTDNVRQASRQQYRPCSRPSVAMAWFRRLSRRWAVLKQVPAGSLKLSVSSKASRFRPTSWRLTRLSKPRAQASRARFRRGRVGGACARSALVVGIEGNSGLDSRIRRMRQGRRGTRERRGTSMAEIMQAIARVTALMEEIAAASVEQGHGITVKAVSEMDRATQHNAAYVEEVAAAAQSLDDRSKQLVAMISNFIVREGDNPPVPEVPGTQRMVRPR